ncbi:nuclear transport factor 2 family protein [Thioalkalicoccus limnaeus]|uniref:Nuclear transport factor 2 family protein n=1 Tax=Thioalkalicoccus limnaeus TaxID=120681 RepID=A0ABV4BE72_9GAMM
MKRIAAVALAAGTVALGVQAELGQPPDQALRDAVRALWQTQYKALDAHDLDGVLGTYVDTDDIMLMGTGPGEHWVGKSDVRGAYARFMDDFEPNTMEVTCGEGEGASHDGVLWLTAVCQFRDRHQEQTREYVTNVSAVLVKQSDAWRFHTMHFSQLTGGDDLAPPPASE